MPTKYGTGDSRPSGERDAEAWLTRARQALRTGEPAEAREAFVHVLALRPGDVEALYGLAGLDLARGDHEGALGYYRQLLHHPPERSDARFNIGVIEADRGRWDRAAAAFEAVAEERPDYPRAHLALGEALEAAARPVEALEAYGRAAELVPSDPLPRVARARLLARQGARAPALRELRTARLLAPEAAELRELERRIRRGEVGGEARSIGLFDSEGAGAP